MGRNTSRLNAAPVSKAELDIVEEYVALDDEEPYCNMGGRAGLLSSRVFHSVNGKSLHLQPPPGVSYSENFNFDDLAEYSPGSAWEVTTTWHMPRSKTPHIVALTRSETPEGDGLFHGEIKTAIRTMFGRLKNPSTRRSVVAPVPLFSAIGKHHLRDIVAYHNRQQLVMRTTPLIDMRKRDEELLTRWCLGYWHYGSRSRFHDT
ncbi:hypothetical protein BDW68DRAFT_167450 [Aspergillus falconensis]